MSHYNGYSQLLPLFRVYLRNIYIALISREYCEETIEQLELQAAAQGITDDERKVYDMCSLAILLEDIINCLENEDKERFDLMEPYLYSLAKKLKSTVVQIQ